MRWITCGFLVLGGFNLYWQQWHHAYVCLAAGSVTLIFAVWERK
jgi:hypothetical protein